MSELIAEARVLVTPDTTNFRTQLEIQTTAAARGVTVPVTVTPVVATAGGVGQAALLSQTSALADEERRLAREMEGATAAQKNAIRANTAHTQSLKQLGTGAGSAAASLLGVRGATLAAGAPFLAGAAAAITFSKSIQLATSFNSEIAVLGAVTEATGAQLARAADAAREFGADITLPGVTAGDAAKTITEFSKAGLSLEDSISATRGGLQLAQAANLEFADAVQLSANALNAFNLEGDQAVHVADVLANAANLAQGGIADTALALRQAAAAAEVVGVSFEDTSALLTLLARNGLTGSDAGTSLRTAFLRLVNPSKEANAIIERLGINLRDMQGNVRPDVFADFAAAQADLSVKTQQANAAIVFGQDAFRAFGILGKEGAAGLREVQEGLEKTGTAAEIARARMTGLAGAQENLSNQLDTFGLTVGQAVTPFVTSLVTGLGNAVKGLNLATGALRALGKEDLDIDTAPLEDLRDRLQEITDEADHFRESGGFVPPRLTNEADQIVAKVEEIGQALLDSPAGLTGFVEHFSRASPEIRRALQDGIITPLEETEIAATRLGAAFLDIAPGRLFEGGFSQLEADAKKLADAMGQAGEDVANSFFKFFEITARRAGKQVGATLKEVVIDMTSTLGLDLAVAQASGNEGAELAVLRQQEQRQADFLEAVLGRERTEKNVALATEAAENLDRTRSRITAIVEGNAADAKRDQDEQQRIAKNQRQEEEKAFLQAQQDARSRQERSVTIAGDTAGLRDDIREQRELRALIILQIAEIKQSALSEDAKQQAIRQLRAERDATADEIRDLRQADKEARDAAKAERLDAQEALAQSIFDLTGNKNPLLASIQAQIKVAITARNAAKKGSLAWVQAQTEINRLLKQRKDLFEEMDDSSSDAVGGTTLADLFKENQEIARQAGNVGQSAAGLTTSAINQPIRSIVETQLTVKAQRDPMQGFQGGVDRLVEALEELTRTINGGNGTTGGTRNGVNQNAWGELSKEQRFFYQKQAKAMVDHGLQGRGGI